MLKNFEKKFGNKEEVVIINGDYDQGSSKIKGIESVVRNRLSKLFIK